jgi:hypothetical protein
VSVEEVIWMIDEEIMNTLYNEKTVSFETIIRFMASATPKGRHYAETEDMHSLGVYATEIMQDIQKRFNETLDCDLYTIDVDGESYNITQDAYLQLYEITIPVFDEDGQFERKELPNFDMEEYI